MSDTIVILSEEFLKRIHLALGEMQVKFALPVIMEIQAWFDKAEKEPAKLIADVQAHLEQFRTKLGAS